MFFPNRMCFPLLCLSLSLILLPFVSSIFNSSSSLPFCHSDESFALLEFKNSFTTFDISWKNGTDCCEWEGITCHPTTHHVIELDLNERGLVGTLGPNSTLFLLRHLQSIILASNHFYGSSISPKFGQFPFLKHLDLSDCGFTGRVPIEKGQLSQLEYLDLSFNDGLYLNSPLYNWSRSLDYLDLTLVNLSSNIPSSLAYSQLEVLGLSRCNLHGTIPTWVWNVTSEIDLYDNYLTGNLPSQVNASKLSSFTSLHLDKNSLTGEIPSWPFILESIEVIFLGHNHFTSGPVAFHHNITNMNLVTIDLSFNNLNGNISIGILSKFPNLTSIDLSSSGLAVAIADACVNTTANWPEQLGTLSLSNTNIHSELPKWIQQTWKDTLLFLDLSQNYLTGSLSSFPWRNLIFIDISSNMFEGPLPTPPNSTDTFYASSNKFTGSIDSTACRFEARLAVLDLHNNSLSGDLQHCARIVSSNLKLLNLGSNNIHGVLPATIPNCEKLEYLDLSDNSLQGSIPQALARCTSLQVINFRRNNFAEKFPHWLAGLPRIVVLDLGSNKFHGEITSSKSNQLYPTLRILDLSSNNFGGKIPIAWIGNFKAMMNVAAVESTPEYMDLMYYHEYFFSIVLTFNGLILKYDKIITSLVVFDLSNNAFEGEIPYNIGELVSMHGLNLSHNELTGSIPPSIGKLTLLNCLDLSHNMLTGHIPQELASLTSLGVFYISENELIGPVPQGKNFDTFEVSSYEGNVGLCGFPLPECGKDGRPKLGPPIRESEDDDNSDDEGIFMLSEWKIITMGYACGTIVGLAWGYYMLSVGRPFWFVKCAQKIEWAALDFYEKQFGRRGRRAQRLRRN